MHLIQRHQTSGRIAVIAGASLAVLVCLASCGSSSDGIRSEGAVGTAVEPPEETPPEESRPEATATATVAVAVERRVPDAIQVSGDELTAGVQIEVSDPESLTETVTLFAPSASVEFQTVQQALATAGHTVVTPWGDYDAVFFFRDAFCGVAPLVALHKMEDSALLVDVAHVAEVDCNAAEFDFGIGFMLAEGAKHMPIRATFTPHRS